MRGKLVIAASVAFTVLLSGCLETKALDLGGLNPVEQLGATGHVVVAVIDTGVNPYHSEFKELYDERDPATYIPGYPADAKVLRLNPWTKGAANRNEPDLDLWKATQSETLYRVEGTKIIGLISFSGNLPGSGHGTMTASRATGNTVSVGGPEVRLVMVVGFALEGIKWAADQPWIDAISISSGVSTGALVPGSGHVLDGAAMDAFQYAAHKKPFFSSSGNGFGNAGVLGFPAWMRGPSGVPDVISVGANDNGKLAVWHNQHSYVVGDGCSNPSATDGDAGKISNTGGGTSSATPFTAGAGAHLIAEARRILGDGHVGVRTLDAPAKSFSSWSSGWAGDASVALAMGDAAAAGIKEGPLADGVLTLQEFKDILYHTAIEGGSEEPSDGLACLVLAGGLVAGRDVPDHVRHQFEGYGEVTSKSILAAIDVLNGGANPARPVEDDWYARHHSIRSATTP